MEPLLNKRNASVCSKSNLVAFFVFNRGLYYTRIVLSTNSILIDKKKSCVQTTTKINKVERTSQKSYSMSVYLSISANLAYLFSKAKFVHPSLFYI